MHLRGDTNTPSFSLYVDHAPHSRQGQRGANAAGPLGGTWASGQGEVPLGTRQLKAAAPNMVCSAQSLPTV
jgi:hypothetical protein